MTSEELNAWIYEIESDLEDSNSVYLDMMPKELRYAMKILPYYGWYWRAVDFDKRIPLGRSTESGWVGVMVNNKWSYEEHAATLTESQRIRDAVEAFVTAPSKETAKAAFDVIQSAWPSI